MFESTEELAIHKLLLLYLLQQLKLSISNTKLTELILQKNYMDYFSLQQYISELLEANLIHAAKEKDKAVYTITKEGMQMLDYFSNRIPEDLRTSVDDYVSKNKTVIKNAMNITAEYIPEKENEYIVHCKIKENHIVLLDLKINMASKEQAKKICNHFKSNPQKIYSEMINSLLTER